MLRPHHSARPPGGTLSTNDSDFDKGAVSLMKLDMGLCVGLGVPMCIAVVVLLILLCRHSKWRQPAHFSNLHQPIRAAGPAILRRPSAARSSPHQRPSPRLCRLCRQPRTRRHHCVDPSISSLCPASIRQSNRSSSSTVRGGSRTSGAAGWCKMRMICQCCQLRQSG